MRKLISIFIFVSAFVSLLGCQRVVLTSADELTSKVWYCENQNGIEAKLTFDGSFSRFSITSSEEGENCDIYGRYSVDKDRFYISDDELLRTYEFSYEVYRDRLYVSYGENRVEFRPVTP